MGRKYGKSGWAVSVGLIVLVALPVGSADAQRPTRSIGGARQSLDATPAEDGANHFATDRRVLSPRLGNRPRALGARSWGAGTYPTDGSQGDGRYPLIAVLGPRTPLAFGAGSAAVPGYPSFIGSAYDWTAVAAGYPYANGLGISIGMSPADQARYRNQLFQLNASRDVLQNAQAREANASAAYAGRLARSKDPATSLPTTTTKPNSSVDSVPTPFGPIRRQSRRRVFLPTASLLDGSGHVLWPNFAPAVPEKLAEARKSLDDAVGSVVKDYQQVGKATVTDVMGARRNLYVYGRSAMEQVHSKAPDQAAALAQFLNSLDQAILDMGIPTGVGPIGTPSVEPHDSPKSGDDLPKESAKDEPKSDTSTPPADPGR
jgi:hypothetical protein